MINSGVVLVTFFIVVNFYRMGRVYLGLQVESIILVHHYRKNLVGLEASNSLKKEEREEMPLCIWFSSFVLIIQFVT